MGYRWMCHKLRWRGKESGIIETHSPSAPAGDWFLWSAGSPRFIWAFVPQWNTHHWIRLFQLQLELLVDAVCPEQRAEHLRE